MNLTPIIPPISRGPTEEGLESYFIENFKECNVFLDLGAADGWYSYLATLHMKADSLIYLVEGDPRYNDGSIKTTPYGLQTMVDSWKNVPNGKNKSIKYLQSLVTSAEKFKASPKGTLYNTSGHSSFTDSNMFSHSQKWEVDNFTLDSLNLPKTKKIFIKCDVEGAELDVVQGSLNLIKDNPSVWIIEIHNNFLNKRNQSADSIKQIFLDQGYEFISLGNTRVQHDIEFWMFKNY